MQSNPLQTSRIGRAVNDLVLAEMFLVQATIESVVVIGDGFKKITAGDASEQAGQPVSKVLQQTAGQALEPYTSRFKLLRSLIDSDS